MFFVSLHTETLQKPYGKHAKTPERSLINTRPVPIWKDSNPNFKSIIRRIVLKVSKYSNHSDERLKVRRRNYILNKNPSLLLPIETQDQSVTFLPFCFVKRPYGTIGLVISAGGKVGLFIKLNRFR